ncbi:MAG: SRPBCC family protein [Myxococcota bacterium]
MEPLVLRSSVNVPASPEAVWAVLADVPRWPLWCPPVRRITHFAELTTGGRVAYVLGMGPGIPVTFDVELQIVEPPQRLQWTSTKWWGVRGTRAFQLRPIDGGTEVVDEKTFESKWWPVASLYPRQTVSTMSNAWLDGLRTAVMEAG